MTSNFRAWTRGGAGATALLVGLTLAAPPCGAAEARPPVANSLRSAAAARAAALDLAPEANLQAAPQSGSSFLHSKKGVATLILMAGGVAWALVSRSQDALHSPAR